MKKYLKLIIITAFLSSITVLIVGIVNSNNDMIIGGVIGIMCSTIIFTSIMIENNTRSETILPIITPTHQDESPNIIITISNPIRKA